MAADDKYVSLGGLTHYDEKIKEYAKDYCAVLEDANWQKTRTAGAVSFLPAPEMRLDPVVNFKFTETGPAEGTKGPDNPSTIAGVTQAKVTRCGKNLLPSYSDSSRGIWTVNADGSVTATATSNPSQTWFNIVTLLDGFVLYPGTYTISGCTGGSSSTYCFNFNTKKADGTVTYRLCSTQPVTFTLTEKETVAANLYIATGVTLDYTFHPQLELADTASTYEQAVPTDYIVNLGGTYYGGSLDLSAGTMTVTHVIKPLTGTEHISSSATSQGTTRVEYSTFAVGDDLPTNPSVASQTSTHLAFSTSPSFNFEHFFIDSTGRLKIFLNVSSEEDALAWLVSQNTAGTPFSVVYPLANPYAVQLTPAQIKSLPALSKYEPRTNIVYSDQESVRVGYPKSPIATDSELTNAIISLGGNV